MPHTSLRIFFILMLYSVSIMPRSIHRVSSRPMPCIVTQWIDEDASRPKTYRLHHNNLEVGPIFNQYDRDYFLDHLLPDDEILSRLPPTNADHPVFGIHLQELLEDLIKEIHSLDYRRSEYQHFIVLKQRDFNPKTHAGLIILKFKHYPFVVKLFMETPATFVTPFSKGFEPMIFFIMGGGINRYLSGFSRLKNAERIREIVAESPTWKDRIDVPRKWFWKPKDQKWFEVRSEHLGTHEHYVKLPSIYAIVCDAIDIETTLDIFDADHRKLGMELSHFLGVRIDPHITNFVIEKNTQKIIIVDTEHFPTMVGLREPLEFDSYPEWYLRLMQKCCNDGFLRSKQERLMIQYRDETDIITC
jgi:hypothetical protein